jgi:hypothetical protein
MLVLVLEPAEGEGALYFYEGRVIRAGVRQEGQAQERRPHLRAAQPGEGKFEFRNLVVEDKDEIRTPTMHLLLEAPA